VNDQQHPYDPYYQQPQLIGYDEYGRPVYQQSQEPQGYDPYARQQPQHHTDPAGNPSADGYAYGGYRAGTAGQDDTGTGTANSYDAYQQIPSQGGEAQQYAYGYGTGYETPGAAPDQQQPADATGQWSTAAHSYQETAGHGAAATEALTVTAAPATAQEAPGGVSPADSGLSVPGQRRPEGERDYRTEQFSFIEEPDEDSQDVIDWLKFTESRSERREEAKRRGRNRVVALGVFLSIVLIGTLGYVIVSGAFSGDEKKTASAGPQKRDVIVVHLHNTRKKGMTSTALLVDNVTARRGSTLLLPNSLTVANDDGTGTTLAKSVDGDGSTGTREAVGSLLGAKITGTWRLDTPYLENLVELVGGIDLTTDAEVPGEKKGAAPQVKKGENQTLNGRAAVAYATHRGQGEPEAAQLQRFGQVMQGVLRKFPSDTGAATVTVETLAQILDPSLTEKDLGASLAKLSEHAKGGDYRTTLLPVEQDGTVTQQASAEVVKDILGGKITTPEKGAALRVTIRNGTGEAPATENARVALVNGGYTVLDSGRADSTPASRITYADDARKAEAAEVAKTLGLPAGAVRKGATAPNADITVVLGKDYRTG
jgi:hypothetical protein